MQLISGFSQGSPVLPSLHSGAAPCSPLFTLIGPQYLDVKCRSNIYTLHSEHTPQKSIKKITPKHYITARAKKLEIHVIDLSSGEHTYENTMATSHLYYTAVTQQRSYRNTNAWHATRSQEHKEFITLHLTYGIQTNNSTKRGPSGDKCNSERYSHIALISPTPNRPGLAAIAASSSARIPRSLPAPDDCTSSHDTHTHTRILRNDPFFQKWLQGSTTPVTGISDSEPVDAFCLLRVTCRRKLVGEMCGTVEGIIIVFNSITVAIVIINAAFMIGFTSCCILNI
ncbi:hypothetical protein PR048_023299 [Dryococelus australis]|uniref:Uncharacterized protein n=1 Tax=Dryococelus australis TaxID=614101 RepID=A0ABQ9GTP2_9NEOP|nr:hypothetical protein PR048_023299 [Dryococelus australis]